MPRKAKDKEELVEKKDVKKENHKGRKAKNSITDKKYVFAKKEKKKHKHILMQELKKLLFQHQLVKI